MAGRKEARIFASIWRDTTFLERSAREQRMYFFLLSQPDLSFCGVISLRMRRWARSAADLTAAQVQEDLEGLAQTGPPGEAETEGERPLIVVDEDTEEVLLRSFIRRDRVWKSPNLLKSAREAATLVESPKILKEILEELHRLPVAESNSSEARQVLRAFIGDIEDRLGVQGTPPRGSSDPEPNPSDEGSGEGSGTGSAKGSRNPSKDGSAPREQPAKGEEDTTEPPGAAGQIPGMPPPAPPKAPDPKAPDPGSDDDPDWVKFWAGWPKKTGKAAARKAWAKAVKKAAPFVIIAGSERYRDLVQYERREQRFIKDPATWLNGEHWTDEIQIGQQRQTGTDGPFGFGPLDNVNDLWKDRR